MDESAPVLRDEASLAHRRGDIERAAAIFRRILELHPHAPEALDAKLYLSSLPARRGPMSVGEPGKDSGRPKAAGKGER